MSVSGRNGGWRPAPPEPRTIKASGLFGGGCAAGAERVGDPQIPGP